MAAFDNVKQKMVGLSGLKMETGAVATIAGVSSQVFTVATKLRKVVMGIGIMTTDGLPAHATVEVTSDGQAEFTRMGSISTSADTISYVLYGH
jgi:hypothetical protein